jgi:hypothetical protein
MQPSEIQQSIIDSSIRIESKGERLNEGVSEQNPENNTQTQDKEWKRRINKNRVAISRNKEVRICQVVMSPTHFTCT